MMLQVVLFRGNTVTDHV